LQLQYVRSQEFPFHSSHPFSRYNSLRHEVSIPTQYSWTEYSRKGAVGTSHCCKVHQPNKPGEVLLEKERKKSTFKYLLNSTLQLSIGLKNKRLLSHLRCVTLMEALRAPRHACNPQFGRCRMRSNILIYRVTTNVASLVRPSDVTSEEHAIT
jgi:hypothetical protein